MRSRAHFFKLVAIVAILTGAIVPILYAYFTYTPTVNVQCGICHTMQFYVNNISEPHAKYSCLVCHHIDVGSIATMIWKYVTESSTPHLIFEKYYPRKNLLKVCEKCHTEPEKLAIHNIHMSVVETTGTCSICHTIHIKDFLEQSCKNCHPYLNTIEKHMEMHGSTTTILAPQNCAGCHSPQSSAPVLPASTCLQASVEGKSCVTCHSQLKPPDISGKPCTSCHYR